VARKIKVNGEPGLKVWQLLSPDEEYRVVDRAIMKGGTKLAQFQEGE
jgi:hypothetical protein